MHLTAAAIAVANGNNVAWSAVYAGQMVTGAAAKEFITFDSSSSATPFVFLGTDATTHFGVLKHGDSGSTVAATFNATAFDTSAHVFSVIHAGTTVSDWIDGTAKDSAAAQNTGATTLDGCTLFGALLGGGFSRATNARLHSFGLYNYGISTALRQMTEAWAAL
jgi:hypothetical protein